jgi:diguanylate cyclase (GGDEF)-like protein/PAS domain S-box-containing protein
MSPKDKNHLDMLAATLRELNEALHLRAESQARREAADSPHDLSTPSPEALQRTLHELRVHQIQLEMQNEELRRMHSELDVARRGYQKLYDEAPVGYLSVSAGGLIAQANLTCARLLGVPRPQLLAQPLKHFVFKDDQASYEVLSQNSLSRGEPMSSDVRLLGGDGLSFWAHLEAVAAVGEQGESLLHLVVSDISQRKRAESDLRESQERWKFAIEGAGDGVWDWNIQTGEAMYSRRWKEMLGYQEHEISNQASEWSSRVHPEDMPRVTAALEAHMAGRTPAATVEFRIKCKDGHWLWTLGRGMVISRTPDGNALRLVGTNADISERKRSEEALREQKEFFHLIAENMGDFIAVMDLQGRRLYNSPSYAEFMGAQSDLTGSDSFLQIHPDDRERVKKIFFETVETGVGRQMEYRFVRPDGSVSEMRSRGSVIRNAQGQVERVVVVSHDITARRQMEDQLRRLAFYDTLTNLPNRRLFIDRLNQAMAASARSGLYGALMFLDLDNFKPLNDTYGHAVGDLLLVEAARRLSGCVREVDTVSRFGGDEFVVMLGELDADKAASTAQAGVVAEKIRLAVSEPYSLTVTREDQAEITVQHHCTASIGATLFLNHEARQGDILRWADRAMYQAKDAGRNTVCFFDRDEAGDSVAGALPIF